MVELNQISFSYHSNETSEQENSLHNVTLRIHPGEAVLFCGESGCGKTTLTRMINGLIPNYFEGELTGRATVLGMDAATTPMHILSQKVGSVFQNPRTQFFCVDTTSEIAFSCENLGISKEGMWERINEVSSQLQIEPLLGKNIFHLSGGEKQKIACASASVLDADIMVLDEPSSNLDMEAIGDLRNILMDWKRRGKTILIAEHRIHYLKDLADTVVFIEKGSIKAIWPAQDFFSKTEEETARLGLRTPSLRNMNFSLSHVTQGEKSLFLYNFYHRYPNGQHELQIDECVLPQNEVIAIIGKNGAGKSTFSRCLCGLEHGNSGEIVIDGRSIKKRQLRKECYMVFQDANHQLFTESVLEEVLISMKTASEEQALEILSSLDLKQFAKRHPMSLSGGQKQRLAIACAVASDRSIIVLDEPTSGLDYRHMREVAMVIRRLQQNGKTVLVVTHDPELINCCCTHVLEIDNGKVNGNYPMDCAGLSRVKNFFYQSLHHARSMKQ